MLKPLSMSQCCSMDYMKGYNAAIEKANVRVAKLEAEKETAVALIVDHLWDIHPSTNLLDKEKLEREIRALINP